MIDQLLNNDGYVSHAFNYWGDALRAKSRMPRIEGDAFFAWLKRNLRDNRPYDELVREMLTARGRYWKEPATAYYLRDEMNRFAGVEATTALFLGIEIGCAQCHDHPFDRWTQRDYHEFAGYYLSARTYMPKEERLKHFDAAIVEEHRILFQDWLKAKKVAEDQLERGEKAVVPAFPEMAGISEDTRQRIKEATRSLDFKQMAYITLNSRVQRHVAVPNKYHKALLPTNYRYEDGKPGDRVEPRFLFGETPPYEHPQQLLTQLADWVTDPENPQFTRVLVNRLWTWMTGASLVGPLDDVLDLEQSADPRLVLHLEALMRACDYDLKQFLRILANTRYYQSAVSLEPFEISAPSLPTGPLPRRLTAEEVWDSLVLLADDRIDSNIATSPPDYAFVDAVFEAKDPDEYWDVILTEWKRRMDAGNAFSNRNIAKRKIKEIGFGEDDMKRASEIDQPAPDGHFLRIFGQSNRELIDNAWDNPTVPQALTLMNGPLFRRIADEESAFRAALAKAETPEAKVEIVFLSVVSRFPTPDETRLVLESLTRDEKDEPLYEDLAWSLINTRQFLFRP